MRFFHVLVVAVSLVLSAAASAQRFPAKPVVIVVAFSAGGGQDIFARAMGQELTQIWGQPVLVENRTGANGIIGTEYVAKAAPDGYTLLFSDSSSMMLTPLLYKGKVQYDPDRDFTAVSGLVTYPYGLAVSPKLPAGNMRDLIALAKAKPGQLSYATFGIGSAIHLVTEMFAKATGIQLNHVPYKGSGPALVDVSGGHVDMMISTLGSLLSYMKSGKLKMLAVTSPKRTRMYPDVPSLEEFGVTGVDAPGFSGIHAPRGTPRAVLEKLNGDIQKVIQQPAFMAKNLEPQAYDVFVGSPADVDKWVKAERAKWAKVIRDANITIN